MRQNKKQIERLINMDMPLVSIVTPCYNGEKYIERFFHSILAQKYKNLQLIFVNDGSTDSTVEIAQSYKEQFISSHIDFIILSQDNNGQASALNRGLKKVRGKYLLCMDSDDSLSENYINEPVKLMENDKNLAYCHGNACYIDNDGNTLKYFEKRNSQNFKDMFYDIVFHPQKVFFSGYLVRTEFLDCVVKDREIYTGKGGQNVQILLPLAWYYGEPAFIDNITYNYYIISTSHSHSQNTSEKVIEQLENYKKILISTITMMSISTDEKNSIVKDIDKHYTKLCFGNAVDTKKSTLIKKYYNELKLQKSLTMRERLLKLKYCNLIKG
jgi:glycosyltransferase involved in cell wall biosynthesis